MSVHTLFVRSGDECSSGLRFRTVETPFWAGTEPKAFRKSWNLKSPNPSLSRGTSRSDSYASTKKDRKTGQMVCTWGGIRTLRNPFSIRLYGDHHFKT